MTTTDLSSLLAQTRIMTQGMTDFVRFQETILEAIGSAKLDDPAGKCAVQGATISQQQIEHVRVQMTNMRQRLGHKLRWELTITQDQHSNDITSAFVVSLDPAWARGTIPVVLRQRVCSHPQGTREREIAHPYPWTLAIYDYGGGNTLLSHEHLATHVPELFNVPQAVKKSLVQKIKLVLPDTQNRILTAEEALLSARVMTRAFLRLE